MSEVKNTMHLLFFRLGGLMVNNIVSIAAAIFLGVTKPANSFALLIIGRIIIGVFAGKF